MSAKRTELEELDDTLKAFGVTLLRTSEGEALVRRGDANPLYRQFEAYGLKQRVPVQHLQTDFELSVLLTIRRLRAAAG